VGELETAALAYLEPLELPEDDPRALVARMTLRLARALDVQVTAAMARELRGCLALLAELEPDSGRAGAQAQALLAELKRLTR
jgi:hypothetical protein